MLETMAADARYAHHIIERICAEAGPGLPGSPQEHLRAAIIQGELEAHLGAGNAALEEFTVAPRAFVSAYPVNGLFMLLAVLLNISMGRFTGVGPWVSAGAGLVCCILAILAIILQFYLNYPLVDPFLPKAQSVNVVGRLRKPGTEHVKRLLIVSGHHDSAPANTWFGLLHEVKRLLIGSGPHDRARDARWYRRLGYLFYCVSAIWSLGNVTMLALAIIQLAGVIAGNAGLVRLGTVAWVLLVCPIGPAVIVSLFFTRQGRNGGIVPGALDNLSASAVTVAASRFLAQNPSYIPAGTEIRFISFGSEEAGLRGSRRYVERHRDELKRLDARVLNFETLAQPQLIVLNAEASGTVKVSPEMVHSVAMAAERAGVPHRVGAPWFGAGGDAAPFSQAGLRALTVIAMKMPEDMIAFYHQKWDRPDVLSMEALQNALRLAVEWIRCGGE